MKLNLQRLLHRAFQAGVIAKGLDGILELAGGTALFLTTQAALHRIVAIFTHEELIEDPQDFVANLIVRASHHLSIHTQHFAGVYLLAHGMIKLGLAIGLLRGIPWTYPAALFFLTTFAFYQLYRVSGTHSVTLLLLTAFDLIVIALIWHEWRRAGKRTCFPANRRPIRP